VTRTTDVHWFAVDIAGNTEQRYRPDGTDTNTATKPSR
jgi:hypothetical protein